VGPNPAQFPVTSPVFLVSADAPRSGSEEDCYDRAILVEMGFGSIGRENGEARAREAGKGGLTTTDRPSHQFTGSGAGNRA